MARNAGVLNFNEEPCTHWSDRDVYNALTSTPEKYLHWVHQSLEDIANGKVTHDTPSKQIFGDESGDFRSMPSIVYRGSSVSKIVKIIGTNNVQKIVKGKISVGKALNIHPVENFVTDIFDANILSSARTGALSSIALRLINDGVKEISLIGCGNVGYFCAYFCCIRGLDRMHFYDIDCDKALRMKYEFSQMFPFILFEAGSNIPCESVICATDSRTAIPQCLGSDTIISVGADTDYQHEISTDLLNDEKTSIFVDSLDSLRYGDCLLGGINSDKVITLDNLILNKAQPSNRNVFISTGNALLDNITIEYLLKCKTY